MFKRTNVEVFKSLVLKALALRQEGLTHREVTQTLDCGVRSSKLLLSKRGKLIVEMYAKVETA